MQRRAAIANGRHSEEIQRGWLKKQDLMIKYNGILAWFCNKTALIIAETSTSLQLSVGDMLTRVNFPTFTMVDPCYSGLIRSQRNRIFQLAVKICVLQELWEVKLTYLQSRSVPAEVALCELQSSVPQSAASDHTHSIYLLTQGHLQGGSENWTAHLRLNMWENRWFHWHFQKYSWLQCF